MDGKIIDKEIMKYLPKLLDVKGLWERRPELSRNRVEACVNIVLVNYFRT